MIKTGNSRTRTRRRRRPAGGAVAAGIVRKSKPYEFGKAGSAGNAYPPGFSPEGRLSSTRNYRYSFR